MTTMRVVAFSGGVDSQAAALWVRRRYSASEILLLHSDAGGNEHPLTEAFVAEYSRRVFPVVTVQALVKDLGSYGTRGGVARSRREEFHEDDPLTFERLAYLKQRFPSPRAQFCTEILKLAPMRRWLDEHLRRRGIEFERYVGTRCDESARRADTPASRWDESFGCLVHFPIRCWTKRECFAVLRKAQEPINPLYTMGFSRVGCAPCINNNKADVRNLAQRCPEIIDKVRAWETRVGRTFFKPVVPGKALNQIDEVVAWSRTERGGRVPLQTLDDAAACSSRYGLCE